ncbi:MAG TPA: hypothetical protein VL242_45405 [Sorangium sp.]|nr:hypothetical protein [Sorangium sp.]
MSRTREDNWVEHGASPRRARQRLLRPGSSVDLTRNQGARDDLERRGARRSS